MKKHLKLCGTLLGLVSLIVFSSCDNFLKGEEVKSEIEAAIAYANAPSYTISVESGDNSGVVKSPAGGEAAKKVTDIFSVKFEPYADYEFLYWKIIDSARQKEITNGDYIELESLEDAETKCTFKKAPENGIKLCLVPVVAARPQILSYSPILAGDLSVKDTTIQVIFDHEMDDESIYYTDDELKTLMNDLGITDKSDSNLLHSTINEVERYYGYKKDGKTFFKNISITNDRTGENLNHCFTKPYFETKRILVILANTSSLPSDYEQLQITIEKDFFYYSQNKKPIAMTGSKKWIYQVNNKTDSDAPEFITYDAKITEGTCKGNSFSATEIDLNNLKSFASNRFTDENKIQLDIRAKDTGSGLSSSFDLTFTKIYDENYKSVQTLLYSKEYQFDYVTMQDASFNQPIDFGELDDGVYKLSVVLHDRSGCSKNSDCYVIRDNHVQNVDYEIITNIKDEQTISMYLKTRKDIDHVEVHNQSIPNSLYTVPMKGSQGKGDVSIIPNENINNFELCFVDVFDNKSETITKSIPKNELHNGMVYVEGKMVTGQVGNSQVFIEGRTIVIPDLLVCDHEVTYEELNEYLLLMYSEEINTNPAKGAWYDAVLYCNLRSVAENLTPVYYITVEGEKITDINTWIEESDPEFMYFRKSDEGKFRWWYDESNPILDDPINGIKQDKTANGYRLPTEAEWEYIACEANNSNYIYSGGNNIAEVAWYNGNSGDNGGSVNPNIHEVKGKNPNFLGIYDMSGNAYEWCYDWFYSITNGTPEDGAPLVVFDIGDDRRVCRGGSVKNSDTFCTVITRNGCHNALGNNVQGYMGFRVVRTSTVN